MNEFTKFKRIMAMMLLIIIFDLFILKTRIVAKNENLFGIRAISAIIMDEKNNSVLWAKNENEVRAMASLTKIMTAIVAIENKALDSEFEVSNYAASMPETKLFLKAGEKYTLEDLLYAIMLKSANDAAVVIAEGVSGSCEEFCKLMTEKAFLIGCTNTNFLTPNGLDNGNKMHKSTAKEMAMIASYALKNETFKKIISTQEKEISNIENTRKFHLSNSNRLLGKDNVKGIKTGYTNLAGQCFAGYYEDNEKSFITIVLASGWGNAGKEAKWTDTTKMMDYINQNFKNEIIISKGQKIINGVSIDNSYSQKVNMYSNDKLTTLLNDGDIKNARAEVFIYDDIKAPLKKGQIIGEADIYVDDQKRGTIELFIKKDVCEISFINSLNKIIDNVYFKYCI